jgi:DNA transposition AAA+ family ATPase
MPAEKTVLFKRRDSVHVQNLPDGSALLFDTATATAYPVTESAAHIWSLCDGVHSAQQMIDELESRYEIDRETIEKDTLDLIDDLREKELLDEVSADDSE